MRIPDWSLVLQLTAKCWSWNPKCGRKSTLSAADKEKEEKELHALKVKRTETFNKKQTLDPAKEKAEIKAAAAEIKKLDAEIKALEKATEQKIKEQ